MPELPEAERAREALERHALGRVVADADDSDSYVCRPWPPGGIREALVGHKVTGVDRVGKQVLVETDGPVLGLHLGMSGSLRFDEDPGCASSGSRSPSPTAAPWSCATRGGSAG